MSTDDLNEWRALHEEMRELRASLCTAEQRAAPLLSEVHPGQRESAINLIQYLALREHDRGALQNRLAAHGLSSLGRSESHVLAAVESVLCVLERIVDERSEHVSRVSRVQGQALLDEHASTLFGGTMADRKVRVMVTLPRQCAENPALVFELMQRGMDCARINAAHDDLTVWRKMALNVREAARALDRRCQIAVDLPGPKCRTGALEPGPQVLKLKPRRDAAGKVLAPARVWLTASETDARTPHLPLPAEFVDTLLPGDKLTLRDARGRLRRWYVATVAQGAVELVSEETSYVQSGTVLRAAGREAAVGTLPAVEVPLVLSVGDTLALTRAATPGRAAPVVPHVPPQASAHIPCEPPQLVDMVLPGQAVWLDDGRIGGVVAAVDCDAILVRITVARPEGEKLRAGRGINLPDSALKLAAFTERDAQALDFAAEAADIVSVSFVRDPADVHALQDRIARLGRSDLGIILKVETRLGFSRLPELILAAMRTASLGVMIARGDLAVECGFERLAEVQEEILWLCEAAHVPVVWATQVLDTLAKSGRPTRAEVTDAAMAERAECVMLNKGPYIAQAITLLDDILLRMSAHQHKKTALYRALSVAQLFGRRVDRLSRDADAH